MITKKAFSERKTGRIASVATCHPYRNGMLAKVHIGTQDKWVVLTGPQVPVILKNKSCGSLFNYVQMGTYKVRDPKTGIYYDDPVLHVYSPQAKYAEMQYAAELAIAASKKVEAAQTRYSNTAIPVRKPAARQTAVASQDAALAELVSLFKGTGRKVMLLSL